MSSLLTPEEIRESMIVTLKDYKGFDRASTETIVDCLFPLITTQVEQAVKAERERLDLHENEMGFCEISNHVPWQPS